ncbi:unnamed protein product [Amoebophrya sp. A120]|nr:unnamed protein product [Amoebophrya sp. A120]|eukprot:GSA120T00015612001.1
MAVRQENASVRRAYLSGKLLAVMTYFEKKVVTMSSVRKSEFFYVHVVITTKVKKSRANSQKTKQGIKVGEKQSCETRLTLVQRSCFFQQSRLLLCAYFFEIMVEKSKVSQQGLNKQTRCGILLKKKSGVYLLPRRW